MRKTLSLILCFVILMTGIMIMPVMADDTIAPVTSNEKIRTTAANTYTIREQSAAEVVTGNIEVPLKVLTNAEHTFTSLPDYLSDATYFRLTSGWSGSNSPSRNGSYTDVLSFDVNNNAVVYYVLQFSDVDKASNASWLAADEWSLCEDEIIKYYSASNSRTSNYLLYKKEVNVTEGESVTVNVGGCTGAYLPPLVFVDLVVEETFVPETSNEKFYYSSSNVQIIDGNANAEIVTSGFTAPVRKADATTDVEDETYYNSSNLDSYFKVFYDDSAKYFNNIPENIKDALYFRLRSTWHGANGKDASKTCLTFDINSTATVYYVYQSTSDTRDVKTPWIDSEEWTKCDETVEYVSGNRKSNYLLFKKKFIVEDGETQTVSIKGFNDAFVPPMVFVDWADETTKNIAVSYTEGGKVNKPGNQDVTVGETFSIQVTADEGYVVDYVKFNGIDVVLNAQGIYTTTEITDDATIEVAFREIEAIPEVSGYHNVFIYPDEATGLPSGITFATVGESGDYTVKEFGIVFSKTDETPTLEEDGKKYAALSKTVSGQYGVKLFGTGLKFGTTYYTTPYAIYESIHGEYIVYGNPVSFTPANN